MHVICAIHVYDTCHRCFLSCVFVWAEDTRTDLKPGRRTETVVAPFLCVTACVPFTFTLFRSTQLQQLHPTKPGSIQLWIVVGTIYRYVGRHQTLRCIIGSIKPGRREDGVASAKGTTTARKGCGLLESQDASLRFAVCVDSIPLEEYFVSRQLTVCLGLLEARHASLFVFAAYSQVSLRERVFFVVLPPHFLFSSTPN